MSEVKGSVVFLLLRSRIIFLYSIVIWYIVPKVSAIYLTVAVYQNVSNQSLLPHVSKMAAWRYCSNDRFMI